MNNRFDEICKSMAGSVTRRSAFKKFSGGLAAIALAALGLPITTRGATVQGYCQVKSEFFSLYYTGYCMDINGCVFGASTDCPAFGTSAGTAKKNSGVVGFKDACGFAYKIGGRCSFTV
jgi:hypothetical protein